MPYPQRVRERAARPRAQSSSASLKLLVAYTIFVIYGTTIPFRFDFDSATLQRGIQAFRADPFQLVASYGLSLPDIASNLLFFVPFGVMFSFVLMATRNHRWKSVLVKTGIGACLLSSFVEFLQLFESSRTTSLLDVAVNGGGAIVGAVLGLALMSRYPQGVLSYGRERMRDDPAKMVMVFYATMLVVWKLAPFDVTLDLSTLYQALKAIDLSVPTSLSALAEVTADGILFAAFGFLWLQSRASAGRPGSLTASVLYTFLLAAGIELLQLFFLSHTTKLADVLAGLVGGIYGAFVFKLVRESSPVRLINLAAVHWLLYVVLVTLHPFNFEIGTMQVSQSLSQFTLMPYVEYYHKTGPAAVADLIEGILQYALLALLMFERRYRFRQPVDRAALVALAIAAAGFSLLLEMVQLTLPGRYSGVTDGLNAILGVMVGYWLWGQLSWYRQSSLSAPRTEADGRGSGRRRLRQIRDH